MKSHECKSAKVSLRRDFKDFVDFASLNLGTSKRVQTQDPRLQKGSNGGKNSVTLLRETQMSFKRDQRNLKVNTQNTQKESVEGHMKRRDMMSSCSMRGIYGVGLIRKSDLYICVCK